MLRERSDNVSNNNNYIIIIMCLGFICRLQASVMERPNHVAGTVNMLVIRHFIRKAKCHLEKLIFSIRNSFVCLETGH